jgi:hypothetical protein
LLAVIACLAAAPAAHADGDPASDYLLGQAAFVPPDIGVPAAYAAQLDQVLRDAKARGYVIRVALIGSRYDLGSVPVLYRQPKRYAHFLGQELFFVYKGNLLVVMPNGLGVSKGGKPDAAGQRVVDRLAVPGGSGKALASSATRAVVRLAADAGAIVVVPPLPKESSSSANRDRLVIALAAAALLALAGGGYLFRRRTAVS